MFLLAVDWISSCVNILRSQIHQYHNPTLHVLRQADFKLHTPSKVFIYSKLAYHSTTQNKGSHSVQDAGVAQTSSISNLLMTGRQSVWNWQTAVLSIIWFDYTRTYHSCWTLPDIMNLETTSTSVNDKIKFCQWFIIQNSDICISTVHSP